MSDIFSQIDDLLSRLGSGYVCESVGGGFYRVGLRCADGVADLPRPIVCRPRTMRAALLLLLSGI